MQKGFWWVSLDGFSLGARRANWKIWSSPRWLRGGDDTQAGGTKKQNKTKRKKKKPRQFVRGDNKGKQKSRRAKTRCRSVDSYLSERLNLHPMMWQQRQQSPQSFSKVELARWHFYFIPFEYFKSQFFFISICKKNTLHRVQDAERWCCWFRSVRVSRMTSDIFCILRTPEEAPPPNDYLNDVTRGGREYKSNILVNIKAADNQDRRFFCPQFLI